MLRVLGLGGKYLLIGTFAVALSASLDSAHAKQFDVLYTFTGGFDGADPYGDLIADGAGNLYGTTSAGGGSPNCTGGCGTIFKLAPDGTETVLHAFTGGSDGMYPQAGLIESRTGKFYGTTALGGANNWGTVFRIAPSGDEKVLLVFDFRSSGGQPEATMIR